MKTGLLAGGIFLIIISGIGLVVPVNDKGQTLLELNEECSSEGSDFGQWFGAEVEDTCDLLTYMTFGIYGLGFIGFILVIAGAVIPQKKEFVCSTCNYMTADKKQIKIHCAQRHQKGKFYSRKI